MGSSGREAGSRNREQDQSPASGSPATNGHVRRTFTSGGARADLSRSGTGIIKQRSCLSATDNLVVMLTKYDSPPIAVSQVGLDPTAPCLHVVLAELLPWSSAAKSLQGLD